MRNRLTGLLLVALVGAHASEAGAATPADQQRALAQAGAVKIVVKEAGWFRVTQPQLIAAGLPVATDPAKLQLFADGVEQALLVSGNGDATFASDEAIEFYGQGRDTLSTDARTYWLIAGTAGVRVPAQTAPAGAAPPSSFSSVVRLDERTVYLSSVRNGEASNFFAGAVSSTPTVRTLHASHVVPSVTGQTQLRVSLQGVTATSHVVDVSLNGTLLGTVMLENQAAGTFSFGVANLIEGDNQVTLVAHAAADYTALGAIELTYPRQYASDGEDLSAVAPPGTRLTMTGFTTSPVRVIDVTDASRPVELAVTLTPQGATNDARVDVPADLGMHTLYAFTSARVLAPVTVAADAPSSWSTSRDGEILILSHASLLDAVKPLAARRTQEGWSVQVVDLQDVYDEEGFGDKSPAAVRAFIQTARATWRVPPRFVLLVGDASFDPRNYLGKGDFNLAPTKLIDTATMETASDDWLVDADDDGVPDVAIGRLPVRTKTDADVVVAKTLAYAGVADLSRGGLFVSDADGLDLDFSGASAVAETKVADLMPVVRFHKGDPGTTTDDLVAKLSDGPFLVNYMGHGSVSVWDGLLTGNQAAALTNTHASIYVVMNCLNGFFHDLYTTSLAETLLEDPQGGAVVVWASSTLAEFGPQPAYNQEFLMRLTRTSIGEAAIAAKRAITDGEARRTWITFGDPTLFGTPGPVPVVDAGVDGNTTTDAMNEGGADGGVLDAGAPDVNGRDGSGDASFDAADDLADADAMPIMTADAGANDDAAQTPADASADAATSDAAKPMGSGGGCGCELEGHGAGTPGGLTLLVGALVATRRRRAHRRARGRGLGVGLAVLTFALVALGWASTAEAAYSYRMAITLDRTRVGNTGAPTTLTNYPLLLDITDNNLRTAANGGHVQSASGFDISFQGADTTTCGGSSTCTFNYQIESYTATTGHVIAWVQIPGLKTVTATSNQVIYVKYGDAAIVASTENINGTWDTSFKGVWHLNQASSPQTDSTSTGANAAYGGTTPPATATGLISSGVATSGTTGDGYLDYRSTTFNFTSSDTFTFQGWFKTTDSAGPLFSQRDNGGGAPVIDINVGYDGAITAAGKMVTLIRDDTNGTYAEVNTSSTVNDGAWHFFAVTRNGTTTQVYVDGVSVGTGTGAGSGGAITTGASGSYQNIGREGNWVQASYGSTDQRYLGATFDEYRISKTIRTADWIKTDYNTQGTPASTFSIGSETLASCGDGTVIAGEACDDGTIVSGDGCSSTCTVETGYNCTGTAPSVCTTVCQDGIVGGSEGCDDGNATNGDGCSSTCTVETAYICTGTAPSVCKFARFDYYKTITFDRTKVGAAASPTTLANYPVLISITDTSLRTIANGGRVRNANGYDIIFQGYDTTVCGGPGQCTFAHEIEKYDATTGQLIAWVNIGGLNAQTNTADTSIHILFGNQAISTTSERITSTWNSNFKGVWHLNQTPGGAGSMTDSTSNANHGTPTGVTTTSSGRVSAGVTMDGSTSFIAMNSGTSLNTAAAGSFTYSGWVNTTDVTGGVFSLRSSTSGSVVMDLMVGRDGSVTNAKKPMVLIRDDSGGGLNDVFSTTDVADGTWHLMTATHSGTSLQLYVDATLINTSTVSAGAFTSDIRNIGREGRWVSDNYTTTAEEYLAGTLDEFRASNTARTIDWVTTDYNNQSSPSTFITYTTGAGGEVSTNALTVTDLVALDATESCAGTTVAWETGYEIDTLGFNVFREVGGQRVQLNTALIEGAGLSGGGGHRYQLVDAGSADAGRSYWVESVSFSFESTFTGPVAPVSTGGCPTAPTPTSGVAIAADGTAGPAPITGPRENAGAPTSSGSDPAAGGCAVAAGGGQGSLALGLLLGLTALARRRRRAR